MATSETGTSTSNPLGGEYQVFLSFRGPDTRRGFADVLHRDLSEAGIHVFIDYEEIRPGERIDGELLRAINDSRLYIPIFSPNYASSYWCLCELAKMVDNISKKVILPIFYNVKPDDVKLRTPSYENDIQNLEQMMKDKKKNFSSEDANTWRRALTTVGGISGLDLKNYTGDGHLSKSVVDEVVNRLQTRQRRVTEDLVGMENRISAINNLLDIDAGCVRLIGIYGMGGMGKTTLAQKIYNQLCPHFGKSCSFLGDIRETAKDKGLVELQEQLLSDISNSSKARKIRNDDDRIKAIEGTICNKKVLVVLDDVDDGNQIRKLIGRTSLYPGTRILVTTRDSGVLNIRGLKYRFEHYELERLSNEHALQLFSRHAFNSDSPLADYYTLSKGIVSTVGGLPLALQAIGALLFGQKKIKIWEEMLQKLKKTLNKDVLEKLIISYDALEADQKQIFLDIACFFIHAKKAKPIFMWDDCGFSSEHIIDVLTKRCMIKVSDAGEFWMHDQFIDLGRAIAKEGHTRLWDKTDIIHELRSTEEKRSVQALRLDLHNFDDSITVTAEEIKRFPNLQFLWLNPVILQGDFTGCLSKLKWFCLGNRNRAVNEDYPLMPTSLHLENVVVFNVWRHEWTEDAITSLIKEATKLKVLFISFRRSSTSHSSLINISCSIGKLRWLTYLDFGSCEGLKKLPEQIGKLINLQHLSLWNCQNLEELPHSILNLKSLMELELSNCNKIQKLPELPRSLTTLRLRSKSLQSVPDVSNLTNLVELLLSDGSRQGGQSNIIQPCDLACIGRLSKLRKMNLNLLNVCTTSIEWGSLSLLAELRLSGVELQTLKQLPSNLRGLWLDRTQVKQVELDGLPNLEQLDFKSCNPVTRISITSSLNKLRYVRLHWCRKLVEVQFRGVLKSMESLHIESCESFKSLVCLSEEELGCKELQALELTDGRRRVSLISSSLKMLRKLNLRYCPGPQEIQFVSTLEALEEFSVCECISLKSLGGLSNLKNLNRLFITFCENLQVVEGTDKLERLEMLSISRCRSMERIFEASSSKIPKGCVICIWDCERLLNTGSYGSRITWECYREMILNAQTQALDSAVETNFSETGDPLLEQQDDGGEDDNNHEHGGREGDDDNEDGRDDDDDDDVHEDHENNDSEDDEVDNMHSSRRSSPVCSEDDNNENGDVDKEGEGEAGGYSNGKDDEDNEDNNVHEVLQSSHGIAPVYSVGDDDKNNDVNEEGDSDEDRTRMRKRKRGTMKKPKRSKTTVMATTTMNTTMGATTTARTMTATRTRRRFCIHLAGIHKFIPWTTMKRRRKATGEGEWMATTRKTTRSMMKKPKRR